jgi:hypothetical protein
VRRLAREEEVSLGALLRRAIRRLLAEAESANDVDDEGTPP